MTESEGRIPADNDQFAASGVELRLAARALIVARSALRSDGLPNEILSDTPLEMLLALYIEHERPVRDVSDISGTTPSPSLVSQRWLTALQDLGLVELSGDQAHQRVRLTPAGKNKVGTSLSIVIEQHRQLMGDQPRSARQS